MKYISDMQLVQDRMTQTGSYEQRFPSSGAVRVFFQGTYVPNVTGISWRIFQHHRPVYSYASYSPDVVWFGNRLIQGQFTTNTDSRVRMEDVLQRVEHTLAKTPPQSAGTQPTLSGPQAAIVDQEQFVTAVLNGSDWRKLADAKERDAFAKFLGRAQAKAPASRFRAKYTGGNSADKSFIVGIGFSLLVAYKGEDFWYNELEAITSPSRNSQGKTTTFDLPYLNTAKKGYQTNRARGSVRTFGGVRIVGGPDQEIDGSGVPLQDVWSFIASDIDEQVIGPTTGETA